ncbi:MAG: endonuclease/exonuclease/phosphatase family protein [Bacteroidota bacterium]
MSLIIKGIGQLTREKVIIATCLFILFWAFKGYFWVGLFYNVIKWVILIFLLLVLGIRSVRSRRVFLTAYIIFLISLEVLMTRLSWQGTARVDLDSTQELKVLSYNVYFKNGDYKKTLKVIQNADADILLLQEVTPVWHKRLKGKLLHRFPHHYAKPMTSAHGLVIYSRFPLRDTRIVYDEYNQPIAIIAITTIGNAQLHLFNLHLESPAVAVENPNDFFGLMQKNYAMRNR